MCSDCAPAHMRLHIKGVNMPNTTWKRLHSLPHYVEGTLRHSPNYRYGSHLSGLGRVMATVEATGEMIKASAVLAATLVVMLALTTGMVGWLFINTVTHGEMLKSVEGRQDWQDARLLAIEKRLDHLDIVISTEHR